jgi:hypothetical protein
MKERFRKLYNRLNTVINWIESPGYLGMKKAGNILTLMFVLIGSLLSWVGDKSNIISNILVGILMITLYALFFITSLRFYWLKPPKFIRQSTETPSQLFDIFGHWSYLYGIFIYSFFASFFMSAVIFAAIHFIVGLEISIGELFYNLFLLTTAIYTILYFMYHLSVKEIPPKIVKARVSLYLAVVATISAGLFGLSFKEILKPLITYLGLGFVWLTYLIDKVESES